MKIKYRFTFLMNNKDVVNFLNEQKIEITNVEGIGSLEIFNDRSNLNEVVNFLELHNLKYNAATSQCIYTKKEINEAEWLMVRGTWRNDYPQPEKDFGYIHTTYDSSDFCEKCLKGLVQKDIFMIKKKPNWGTKNFLMINWVHDEFFVSSKVETIFRDNNVKGLDFYKVFNRSKKEIEGTKQIYINNYLQPGIKNESIKQELICSKCGYKKYLKKLGFIYYSKDVFTSLDADMIKSHEKFGEMTCSSLIFITQRLYKIIVDNNLGRGLVYEPVQLV